MAKNNFLFEGSGQNDATEFFNTLLITLNEELEFKKIRPPKEINHYEDEVLVLYEKTLLRDDMRGRSIIDDVFTGQYLTTYECQGRKDEGRLCEARYRLV